MRLGEPGPGRGELGRGGRRGGRVEPAAAAAAGGGGGAGGGGESVLRRSGSSSRSSGAAAVVAPSPSSSSIRVRVCARVELRHDASRARTGDGHCSGSRGVRGSRRVQRRKVAAAAARRARCSDAVPVVVASHVSCLAPCVVVVVALIRHSVVPALELAVGVVLLLVGGRGGRCFFFGGRCFFPFRC